MSAGPGSYLSRPTARRAVSSTASPIARAMDTAFLMMQLFMTYGEESEEA